MSIRNIRILIDNSQEKYFSGQSLFGRVACQLTDPSFVEAKLRLNGVGRTLGVKPPNSKALTANRGRVINFLETEDVVIYAGYTSIVDNEFRFNLTLPQRIPSTYEGKYGHVKYFLTASIDVRGKEKCEERTELKVFSPIDLNDCVVKLIASQLGPSTHSDQVLVGYGLFCIPEVIIMEVQLEKTVFTLDEVVFVKAKISNKSSVPVSRVKANIFVNVLATLGSVNGKEELVDTQEVLASNEDLGIRPDREKRYYFSLNMKADAELPNFQGCSLFMQTASLEVTAILQTSQQSELKIKVGLTLGHIRLNPEYVGNVPAEPRFLDVALIRRVSSHGTISTEDDPEKMATSTNSTLTSFRGEHPYSTTLPSAPNQASSSSSTPAFPHITTSLPSSFSSGTDHLIGIDAPSSTGVRTQRPVQPGPSTMNVLQTDFIPSAPVEEGIEDANSMKGMRISSTDGDVDAPPTYEEAISLGGEKDRGCLDTQRKKIPSKFLSR